MALSLQAVKDPATDQNFRRIATQFPVGAASLAKRRVGGVVAAEGAILHGEGFTVSHPATGEYKLILSKELAEFPSCVATGVVGVANVVTADKKEMLITIKSIGTAALANGAFHFVIEEL